jgi:hypothetical protein
MDKFLLEAMREVDELTPSTPPIAPKVELSANNDIVELVANPFYKRGLENSGMEEN